MFIVKTEPTAKPCDVTDSYALSLALIVFKTPKTNLPVQIFELIFVLYCNNMLKFQFLSKRDVSYFIS